MKHYEQPAVNLPMSERVKVFKGGGGGYTPPAVSTPKPPLPTDVSLGRTSKGSPLQKRRGFLSTILTSGVGVTEDASVTRKTLLGG